MTTSPCRWGILGTATIAQKNWRAIANAPNATLSAVASRTEDRANEFIDLCQNAVPFPARPAAVGSYEALMARDDIDAIYIPLPTGIRKKWVIKAAEAGKHVLAEKPTATSTEDLVEMIAACRKNNVQFMDGVMFMHSDRLRAMGEQLWNSDKIGDIRRITSHHTFCAPTEFLEENIRMSSALEPHGCLGDVGWYSIRLILWAMQWRMPQRVVGRNLATQGRADSPGSVPTEFSAELIFDETTSAHFYCSFLAANQQWGSFGGTKGYMQVDDFVLPYFDSSLYFQTGAAEYTIDACDFDMKKHIQRHEVPEYANSRGCSQETRMIGRLSAIASSGSREPAWEKIAYRTQVVMDRCFQSANDGAVALDVPYDDSI
jgi:predicted dehydrogenase